MGDKGDRRWGVGAKNAVFKARLAQNSLLEPVGDLTLRKDKAAL